MIRSRFIVRVLLCLFLLPLAGCSMGSMHRNWGATAFGPPVQPRSLPIENQRLVTVNTSRQQLGLVFVVEQRTERGMVRLRWIKLMSARSPEQG